MIFVDNSHKFDGFLIQSNCVDPCSLQKHTIFKQSSAHTTRARRRRCAVPRCRAAYAIVKAYPLSKTAVVHRPPNSSRKSYDFLPSAKRLQDYNCGICRRSYDYFFFFLALYYIKHRHRPTPPNYRTKAHLIPPRYPRYPRLTSRVRADQAPS